MDNASFFLLGFLTYFMLNRFIDALCFRAGRDNGFDCSKCDLHCAGYACYKHRNTDSGASFQILQQDCVTSPGNIQEKLERASEFCNTEITPVLGAAPEDCNTSDSD